MYEDEEFQAYNFGFSLAEERNITSIINFIKDSESDSYRMAEKAKEGRKQADYVGWKAVSVRFRFLRLVLNVLSTLSNIDVTDNSKIEVEKLNSNFQQIQILAKTFDDTFQIGNKTVVHSDNVELPLVSLTCPNTLNSGRILMHSE